MQVVLPEVSVSLTPVEDLRTIAAVDREAELLRRLKALAGKPFDLSQAPLFRAQLFRTADDEHVFYFGPHHIIWDGWSFDLFYEEMSALYAAYARGDRPSLADLSVDYGDFAAWHRDSVNAVELGAQLDHWKERLAGISEPLGGTHRQARPAEMSGSGATTWVHLPLTYRMRRAGSRGKRRDSLHDVARSLRGHAVTS